MQSLTITNTKTNENKLGNFSSALEIFNSDFLYSYKLPYIILKGLGSFVIMYFIIKLLYTLAPNKKIMSTTYYLLL